MSKNETFCCTLSLITTANRPHNCDCVCLRLSQSFMGGSLLSQANQPANMACFLSPVSVNFFSLPQPILSNHVLCSWCGNNSHSFHLAHGACSQGRWGQVVVTVPALGCPTFHRGILPIIIKPAWFVFSQQLGTYQYSFKETLNVPYLTNFMLIIHVHSQSIIITR